MSHQATTWAFNAGSEPGEKGVGDTARKFLLVAMADHAHKDGRNAFAAVETYADYLECSVRTVQRHMRQLVADGFIRPGDQTMVAHLRRDRRPVVYDLAMSETVRSQWADSDDEHTPTARGDNLSPRPDDDGVTHLSPRPASPGDTSVTPSPGHGVTHGVTKTAPRGDTGVTRTHRTRGTSPQPPASQGSEADATQTRPHVAGCSCRGMRPCRSCGNTPRQVDRDTQRAAADERRRAADAETQAERAHRGRVLSDPAYAEKTATAANAARAAITRSAQ